MLGRMDKYIEDIKPLFQDERFYALYHPVVDFDTMAHEVSDRQILDEVLKIADLQEVYDLTLHL